MRRLPAIGALALLCACSALWQGDEVLGVAVEWPAEGPHPWAELAAAVCDAAAASPDPRVLYGASIVVVATREELELACMQSGVTGCWHPDWDDEDGAGRIYIGPPADGGALADATLRHELGHLARSRWKGGADADHVDAAWWATFDSPETCR